VGASTVGAVAFTSASVTRQVDVTLAADDGDAAVGLAPGVGTSITNGQLVIDGEFEGASGGPFSPNKNGEFTLGDTNDTSNDAFSITNNSSNGHDFEVVVENVTNGSITIDIYDGTENLGTATESSNATFNIASGSTVYAAITLVTETDSLTADVTIQTTS
ncbi:hypothetical protein, partial [Natronomonas sp.]|uniref:hypothetical protein n=1 Tax=Natronomonas sp. TaxID=2184060 RepID=UPI002FC3CD10